MITWTVTEAARNFSDLLGRVYYQGEEALLTKGGRVIAKISPVGIGKTGRELMAVWPSLPRLSQDDADSFGRDVEQARSHILPPKTKWD